jgi:hypothetical protein
VAVTDSRSEQFRVEKKEDEKTLVSRAEAVIRKISIKRIQRQKEPLSTEESGP